MSKKRDTTLGIPFDWYTTSPTWKLRYNKRTFGVTKTEYGFSDDYQLEDIFEWSVDYLKTVNILTDCIHLSLLLDIHSFNEKYLSTTERTLSDLGSLQLKCNLLPKDSICSKNKNAYLFIANEKVQSVCS
mgnify:CR=1 FL=1